MSSYTNIMPCCTMKISYYKITLPCCNFKVAHPIITFKLLIIYAFKSSILLIQFLNVSYLSTILLLELSAVPLKFPIFFLSPWNVYNVLVSSLWPTVILHCAIMSSQSPVVPWQWFFRIWYFHVVPTTCSVVLSVTYCPIKICYYVIIVPCFIMCNITFILVCCALTVPFCPLFPTILPSLLSQFSVVPTELHRIVLSLECHVMM